MTPWGLNHQVCGKRFLCRDVIDTVSAKAISIAHHWNGHLNWHYDDISVIGCAWSCQNGSHQWWDVRQNDNIQWLQIRKLHLRSYFARNTWKIPVPFFLLNSTSIKFYTMKIHDTRRCSNGRIHKRLLCLSPSFNSLLPGETAVILN